MESLKLENLLADRLESICPEACRLVSRMVWRQLVTSFSENRLFDFGGEGNELVQFAIFVERAHPFSALSAWVWHSVLKVLPRAQWEELPACRFQPIGQNGWLTKYFSDVLADPSLTGIGEHFFVYVLEGGSKVRAIEVDRELACNLQTSRCAARVAQQLNDMGVVFYF